MILTHPRRALLSFLHRNETKEKDLMMTVAQAASPTTSWCLVDAIPLLSPGMVTRRLVVVVVTRAWSGGSATAAGGITDKAKGKFTTRGLAAFAGLKRGRRLDHLCWGSILDVGHSLRRP